MAKQQARVAAGFDVEAVTIAIHFDQVVRLDGVAAHRDLAAYHVEKYLPPRRHG